MNKKETPTIVSPLVIDFSLLAFNFNVIFSACTSYTTEPLRVEGKDFQSGYGKGIIYKCNDLKVNRSGSKALTNGGEGGIRTLDRG
jgi:hypothetical protein